VTSWLGYDSTTVPGIPRGAQFIFPYRNGRYAWTEQQADQFTHAGRAWIDVIGNAARTSHVLDVETGDATPQQAPAWIRERHALGAQATVYCNRSTLPVVQQQCHGLDFWVWLATLDGTVCYESVPGTGGRLAAVQGWGAAAAGFHADVSVILNAQWYGLHGGK
jgi:hypothetical protein